MIIYRRTLHTNTAVTCFLDDALADSIAHFNGNLTREQVLRAIRTGETVYTNFSAFSATPKHHNNEPVFISAA